MSCGMSGGLAKPRAGVVVILIAWAAGAAILWPDRSPGQVVPRIINGQPTDAFPAVGMVGSVQRGPFCTGTLISPWHVLTAAHCAEMIDDPSEGTFQLGTRLFLTSAILVHPDYNPQTLDNDLAVLELAEPVTGVDPVPLLRVPPQVGDTLWLVGFGAGGDAQSGADGTFGTKRVGTTTIDLLGDTLVVWFFDRPEEANTAPGDSGGPGLLQIDGVFYLASVASAGTEPDAGLGDMALNTRVDAYVDWIDAVIESFQEPGEEGAGDQDAEPGEGGEPEEGGGQPAKPGHRPSRPGLCPPAATPPGHDRPPQLGTGSRRPQPNRHPVHHGWNGWPGVAPNRPRGHGTHPGNGNRLSSSSGRPGPLPASAKGGVRSSRVQGSSLRDALRSGKGTSARR